MWISGEWTYYMHGQLIQWPGWLGIQKHVTAILSLSKPDIFYPYHKEVASLAFVDADNIILHSWIIVWGEIGQVW